MPFEAKSSVSKPDLYSWTGVKVSSQPCSLIFAFPLGAGVDCLISVFLSDKWALNKASLYSAGDPGSIPGLGRSPGEGNGNPLWYSCLENPVDRGASWVMVHKFAKSRTQLKQLNMHTCTHARTHAN